MRFLSVCSGIEAASCAWEPLGWKAHAFSEIEAFPSAVLKHHYPDTPNWGDMTKFKEWPDADVDVLVGGTPCQSFSVAGLRKGMADPRGNLALTFLAIAAKYSPRYVIWENVPGVLSSEQGRDFGAFLGGLGQCGYGWAYRVYDAQYFGVPQRRRRVFVVGYFGDWRRAAAVLFERHSLSGDTPPRREARQSVAALTANGVGTCGADDNQGQAGHLVASTGNTAHCLNAGGMGRQDYETETLIAHSLRAEGFDASETGRGTPLVPVAFKIRSGCEGGGKGYLGSEDAAFTVTASDDQQLFVPGSHANGGAMPAVAFDLRGREAGSQFEGPHDTANIRAASGGSSRSYVAASAVRRLTPRECERLQGFPEIHHEFKVLVCASEDEKNGRVASAERASAAPSLGPNAPVAVNALIDLEREQVQLRSLGRSPWSASIAELANSSRPSISADAFVHLLALMHDAVGLSTRAGKAGSLPSISGSSHRLNGSVSVLLSGQEIDALASDAEQFIAALNDCSKFTTSQLGTTPPICGSPWTTLASCVAAAMIGFIPETMRRGCSYELSLTTHCGYTLAPYRGKPAADGPRYKALGNSMAVPVMRWIGERIAMVEALQARAEAA